MTANNYLHQSNEINKLETLNNNIAELIKFFVLFSHVNKASFFEFNYEFNQFAYSFSINEKEKFIDDTSDGEFSGGENHQVNSIIIEDSNIKYAMLTFDEHIEDSYILRELKTKLKKYLKEKNEILKEMLYEESSINIYLISDSTNISFSTQLKENLKLLVNTNISIVNSAKSIQNNINEKGKKSFLIYTIEDETLLKKEEFILKQLNEFVIVIGPIDFDLPLFCGNLNVYKYLPKEDFAPEQLKHIFLNTSNDIKNKYENYHRLIAVTGISGGVGTTTISMNMANILAKELPDKNILYVDLDTTKSVSNLFLEKNPLPKKTIVDLVNSKEYDIDQNLKNGLVKVRDNFYTITGIQKHIDSDIFEKEFFLENFLEYLSKISDKFNFIIIDTGLATDSSINSSIYNISNEVLLVTEMSLPHISKVKTFFSLMKRAGLKDKIQFFFNRYDSEQALSVNDINSILNLSTEEQHYFEHKIPNDYKHLGECWNYCQLVSDKEKKSKFVVKLKEILKEKDFLEVKKTNSTKSWFNIF